MGAVVSDSELERIRLLLVDLVDLGAGGGVTVHADLTGLDADDHPQYQLRTEKAQANGYASLGAGGLVPTAQLGSGTTGGTKYLAGDGTWKTTPIVISSHSGLTGLSADDHTQYLLVDGTRAMSGNLRAPTISIGGAPLTGPLLSVPVAPTASANYGLISLGSGPFDGSTSGFYVGNSNGTHIAINAASGYTGRMADWQVGGVRMFGVGRPTQASSASATLNAIDLPSFTVTVTGSTNITTAAGFNYTRLGIPTYSAASALTITNAATLAIEGAPAGAGAGPATITNAYALWVQAGATRLLASGTPFAGTGTTSFPLVYLNDTTATASTILNTAGTYFGINAHGSTRDFMNLMLDGVSQLVFTASNGSIFSQGQIYIGGSPTNTGAATALLNGNGINVRSSGGFVWNSNATLNGSTDTSIMRLAAASVRLGAAPSASPVAYTLSLGESSRSGTDSNVAGASGTIQPGAGTGTGATVPLILNAPIQVASGTGAQTQTEFMRGQAVGTSIGLSFYGVAAVARQLLATGAGATVDNVITALQALGLVRQS
jgi:hypothetical protein